MDLDAIQKGAKKKGELVYAIDQGQTDVLVLKPGPCVRKGKKKICPDQPLPGPWGEAVPHGFCSGLALRWVGLRYSGKDYDYNPKTLFCEGLFWEATRDQNIDAPSFIGRVEAVLSQYGAVPNRGRYYTTPLGVSAEMLANVTFAGDGLYYVELVRDGGGHALGFEREGSMYHFFDGNYGHFILNGLKRFKEFMTDYLKATGYGSRYVKGTRVIGMSTPH